MTAARAPGAEPRESHTGDWERSLPDVRYTLGRARRAAHRRAGTTPGRGLSIHRLRCAPLITPTTVENARRVSWALVVVIGCCVLRGV